MKHFPAALIISLLIILSGCTSVQEIRVNHASGPNLPIIDEDNPSKDCGYSNNTVETRAYSIEDYGKFWAAYVELDDEGWLFRDPSQHNQLDALEARLRQDLSDKQYDDSDFLIVAFIHGWHHNAHDSDCNVHEFRAMLKVASERYAAAYPTQLKHPRRIIGVYVGWRGESLPYSALRYTTVLDRRNAGERVAKGDVRKLFAVLRKFQIDASRKAGRDDRMRTVVIGHSFGGLIAFNGLSPAVLNELTLTRPDPTADCTPVVQRIAYDDGSSATAINQPHAPPVFPDMLVLINPAFEATRFEATHELGKPVEGCHYPTFPDLRPKVIVVAADNDRWTGPIFSIGRTALTFLEAYPKEGDANVKSLEKDSNLHAIGFTERYVNHRLAIVDGVAKASLIQPPDAEWRSEPCSPVWVIRAPEEIINGHNGFLYPQLDPSANKQTPYLLNWLVTLHADWKHKGSFLMPQDRCPPAQ